MIENIETLLDNYAAWLHDTMRLHTANDPDWIEITTPFLDRHNDYLQVYVRCSDDTYLLTDDGYTLVDLEQSSVDLESVELQQFISMLLAGFSVRQEGERLEVETTKRDFPQRLNDLIQAMLAIDHLAYITAVTSPAEPAIETKE